jgi:tetratricopeptide (TPR) repeat protein
LVQGFRAGQLSLKKEVPPGFAQLTDPYDPTKNVLYQLPPYGMLDMSYYKGRLYLYFGVTPALILFWPYMVITGHYLSYGQAGVIFCTVGFLASVYLLCALWRRYFAEVSVCVVAAGTLALGLASGVLVMLGRCKHNDVPISCGYALTMLALAAIWKALHEPERRCWWLAAASVAYGLAVGARPSLLFGAAVLLVPVAQAWRERRTMLAPLLAAAGPIVFIGLGLMLYNLLRFDSPFDFGFRYQLVEKGHLTRQFFSLRYLWFNFRVYLLAPARWSARFPFVHDITVPPTPRGYDRVENPFGVLTNIPIVWLALAAPLAWRRRSGQAWPVLRWFVMAVALLFGISVLTAGLFCSAINRYEVDFLPALVLLAVSGILSLERALSERPMWRRAARWGCGLLLGFSVAFNLLAGAKLCAEAQYDLGVALFQAGKVPEAIGHYKRALRLKPDYTGAHYNLGLALARLGRLPEAIGHYERALQIPPDYTDTGSYAEIHNDLGLALVQLGRVPEAIEHYEEALRIQPDYAAAHYNLGLALLQQGRLPEAISHWEQAVRINPDYADAHYNLGLALWQTGQLPEAVGHYEQALRINPDSVEAHVNLGIALSQMGKRQEGLAQFREALRRRPDSAEVHYNVGRALFQTGNVPEAIEQYEQVLQTNPDSVQAHCDLGLALAKLGRTPEAIQQYEQALRIKPDFVRAQNALARARAVQ